MSGISNIRFTGMASGLDTDRIIKDLMRVERYPLERMQQQKQTVMWKREAYREINLLYSSFRNLADTLRMESTFNKKQAVSNNNNIVTAQSGTNGIDGSYSVKVDQLASSAMIIGESIGTVDMSATGLSPGDFEINGKKFTVSASSTRQSVIDEINNAGIGIVASYDATNNRMMLSTTQTGSTAKIVVEDPSNVLKSNLGTSTTITPAVGKNAKVEVNGAAMEIPTNSFTFNNISFSLKGTSSSAVSIDVKQDVDDIISKITNFVNKYNELIETVNGKINEKKNRSYTPLTDEQKEAMTEKQIDLWESKAKVGLLAGDDMLENALLNMRKSFMDKVDGLPYGKNTLSSIGIAVGSSKDAYKENGKLHINMDKLKEALTNDPENVKALFTQTSSLDKNDPARRGQLGFAERIKENMEQAISSLGRKIGTATLSDTVDNSLMGQEIKNFNTKIYNLQYKLETVEDRYYRKFTAMEKALQSLNSKGSWLAQQLGQG